jgi:hypothetical protein
VDVEGVRAGMSSTEIVGAEPGLGREQIGDQERQSDWRGHDDDDQGHKVELDTDTLLTSLGDIIACENSVTSDPLDLTVAVENQAEDTVSGSHLKMFRWCPYLP